MDVLDKWQSVTASRFQDDATRQFLATPSVASTALITYLQEACAVSRAEVAGVVDGFWNYVINKSHYQRGQYLVIPHFGTFRPAVTRSNRPVLKFRSIALPILVQTQLRMISGLPDVGWIRQIERTRPVDPAGLSVKRRITLSVAREQGLDLGMTYGLLKAVLDITTHVFTEGRHRIVWACRGVMCPYPSAGARCYRFRSYRRLSNRLLEGLS